MALNKSKYLLNLTNTILDKKPSGSRFQFWLPTDANLTKNQRIAINCQAPISIFVYDIFANKMALDCFIKRLQQATNKKVLFVAESEFLRFNLKEKLQKYDCIYSFEEVRKKVHTEIYDEILVYDNYDIEALVYLKKKCINLSFLVVNDEYLKYFPDNKVFIFDEIFLPAYEILNFARQFTLKDSKFNDSKWLENLKKRNSGADKPFVYLENNLDEGYQPIKDIIDENPTGNIVIILPYGKDEKNYDLSVEKYYRAISKEYACSKYYESIKLKKLHNIVVTTYDEAKLIDFSIMIFPQFDKVKKIVANETIFSAICSAHNQLYFFQQKCDEYDDNLVYKINNVDEIPF